MTSTCHLLTSQRATNGHACEGCDCYGIPGFWNSVAFPFPIVQTSTTREGQANNGLATAGAGCQRKLPWDKHPVQCELRNASVTSTTRFWVAMRPSTSCYLHVQHMTYPRSMPLNRSRVRVDSLSVSEADCYELCPLMGGYSAFFKRNSLFERLQNCSRDKDAGLPGTHAAPRCLPAQCGPVLSKAPFLSNRRCQRENRSCDDGGEQNL